MSNPMLEEFKERMSLMRAFYESDDYDFVYCCQGFKILLDCSNSPSIYKVQKTDCGRYWIVRCVEELGKPELITKYLSQ